ncbi:MAG TPA: cyclic nucleotide-binding domain-containing protein [Thermoanaerobaculia bacterium]|jgi:CRP-like cAMP-binding protein|nr:cyclic nucleotide-binding domain-containing protein [Thermoanaerobaculia bacterium]
MNVFPLQSDHPLFRYFTDDERVRVERLGELRHVPEGQYLIHAGDTDSTLFAVEGGHLDIVAARDGQTATVATVGPGDVLGEVSFIDDSPRTVSVMAGEATIVRAWNSRTIAEALAFEPQLLAKFSVAMCELLVERIRDAARRV